MKKRAFVQMSDGGFVDFDDVVFAAWDIDPELAREAHELCHFEIEDESERTPQKWYEIAKNLFCPKYRDRDDILEGYGPIWEEEEDIIFDRDKYGFEAEIYYMDSKIK